jgi:dihydrofolate reductase
MRKLTAGLFISIDGVVEDPQDWHFPYFNDEMGIAVNRQLGSADTVLLGRNTYDSFAGAWPDREEARGEDAGMAKALGDARKFVVSNRDLEFTWRNSEQLKGELVEGVTALKNEPGGRSMSFIYWCTRSPSARGRACSTAVMRYR